MASISYRKKGNRWHIRFRKTGKPELTESLPGTLSELAIEKRAYWWEEQIALGRENPWKERKKDFNIMLKEAISLYIQEGIKTEKWKISNGKCRTADTNKNRLTTLLNFLGNISVESITKNTIIEYLNSSNWNAYTKKSNLSTINTFLKWLYQNDYKNSYIKVFLPKATKDRAKEIERQVRGITLYEVKKLCVGLKIRDRELKIDTFSRNYTSREWAIPVLLFVFAFMLRKNEINKIYPEDISRDLKEITIGNFSQSFRPEFIPKGGIKTIPTTNLMKKILKNMNVHAIPRQPIVKHTNDQVYRKLVEARKIIFPEKKIRLHDLRHGGIMYYRSKGWPDSLVSQLARHSSSEVTSKIYGGVDPVELRRTLSTYDVEKV